MAVVPSTTNAASDGTDGQSPSIATMDRSWINGQNRQRTFPLTIDSLGTGVLYLDTYYNANLAHPIDNTQTISAVVGRSGEFSLNLASAGFEGSYRGALVRLWVQTGSMLHLIQETDGSVGRGRNTGTGTLKFIREAAAGYHFDVMHGLNAEVGIFMSYIGLESYLTQENWNYQRSLVCDFTPFYFQGARIQAYPAANYRTELWLLNGWQTYNSWAGGPGIGNSNYWYPTDDIQLVANVYLGRDSRSSDRLRFHHDNSIVARYHRGSGFVNQAAVSLNTHYGFQSGDGVTPADHAMYGTSLANRLWFAERALALTLRADVVANPGAYLAFTPSPVQPNAYTRALEAAGAQPLRMAQFTATVDLMPNDHVTFRLEYVHRTANVPLYAGGGGTTSPDGWSDTPTDGWMPDLRTFEDRLTFALNVRL